MKLENLKLGKEVEITFSEAAEIIKGTEAEHDFYCLNESTITDTVDFELVQDRKYFVTKIGRKGTCLYPGTEFASKTEIGKFEVEMSWNFRHPSNFAQNQNNCNKTFKVAI